MAAICSLAFVPANDVAEAKTTAEDSLALYSKFDFIPGTEILYSNEFEQENLGEFPTGWNTTGSGEVVQFGADKRYGVKLLQNAQFLTDNVKEFSSDFTLEFDLFLDFTSNNAFFPVVSFGIVASGSVKPADRSLLNSYYQGSYWLTNLSAQLEGNSQLTLESFQNGSVFFHSGEKPYPKLENKLKQQVHVSVQVQKERIRLWLDENKVLDLPKALPANTKWNQLMFAVSESSYSDQEIGVYVSKIKIAKGVEDTRKKLLDEGKYSTNGILFDVNSAVIRPESYPILKEIAQAMLAKPETKFNIIGHTDSDGDEALNQKLSEQRAEAVKKALIERFKIDADRLNTAGKGETAPIAENSTREGKAKNRRVEFIKLP